MELDSNNKKGIVTSITIHVVLLLLFAFFGMSYMVPPPEEEGITINFGTVDEGMMNPNQVQPSQKVEEIISETPVEEPNPEQTIEEDILTQDIDEAPSIDQKKEKPTEVQKSIRDLKL